MNKNNIPTNQSNFPPYPINDGKVNVDVFLKDENIWLTQKAINKLFGKSKATTIEHHKKIHAVGKSLMDSTVRNFRTIRTEESRRAELQNTSMSKLINTDPMVKI